MSTKKKRLLFHGSRISNWVGILSRGMLMPHIVTQRGISRTDAGMLGTGIYFGDCSSTAAQYTTPGREGSRMMLICNVALGKVRSSSLSLTLPTPQMH